MLYTKTISFFDYTLNKWSLSVIQTLPEVQTYKATSLTSLPESSGPQTLMVQSSDTLTSMFGSTGFQDTQLTVLVCPCSTAIGISSLMCQMYTLLSINKGNTSRKKYSIRLFSPCTPMVTLSHCLQVYS